MTRFYKEQAEAARRKIRKNELESIATTASVIGIISGLFFLSSNITGNTIANLSIKTTSFLGVILLVIGLITTLLWFIIRKH